MSEQRTAENQHSTDPLAKLHDWRDRRRHELMASGNYGCHEAKRVAHRDTLMQFAYSAETVEELRAIVVLMIEGAGETG